MQTLDVRHWELFLNKEYKIGEWKFEQVYTRHVTSQCSEAAACIFDSNQLRNEGTQGLNFDNTFTFGLLNFESPIFSFTLILMSFQRYGNPLILVFVTPHFVHRIKLDCPDWNI